MRFYKDDIAVVSYTGIFPDADNESDFFQNLINGKCSITDLSKERGNHFDVSCHFSKDKKEEEKSYSKYGTVISLEKINSWAEKYKLNDDTHSCVEIVLHELVDRISQNLNGIIKNKKSECVIAMGTGEPNVARILQKKSFKEIEEKFGWTETEKFRIQKFLERTQNTPKRKELIDKDYFFSLAFESLKNRFGISGPCSFVDAACASSLAAIYTAINRLRSESCDLIITGGLDLGVGITTLVAFSKVQVLSDKIMNPFDQSADGMNQGEAAALFALMRLEDAKKEGLQIHGVIRGCDGSSDGINGGLVEPTERGQVLAYEKTYEDVPMHPLSYLECHGTGTQVGDKTELASTAKFFHPLPPIGSVKANVGHTICAAGAVSLVKALKSIEHKVVPRMPLIKKPIEHKEHSISTENINLASDQNIRIGISSFGFGGANYHLVVDEYKGESISSDNKRVRKRPFQMILNGVEEIDLQYINELFSASKFKIPPVSLPHFDPALLGAIVVTENLFKKLNLRLDASLREEVGVISTSNHFLERFSEIHKKTSWLECLRRLDDDQVEKIKYVKRKIKSFLPTTEDTFAGALNNLIAGKVTKDFDLKGVNFNIASEKISLPTAVDYAQSLLKYRSGAFLILSLDEKINYQAEKLERSHLTAWLVSDLEFSLKANLPVDQVIEKVTNKTFSGETHV